MKLDEPKNKNYAAVVARLPELHDLEGADRIKGAPFFGYQAVVGKDEVPGTLGIVFPAETQLSDEFCKNNNLYRHTDKNADPTKAGFIEDNRRVKALKLRGHRSDCLWLPLSSLSYTKAKLDDLKEGDIFDKLGDQEICRKYIIKEPGEARLDKNKKPKYRRVDNVAFPLHFDTDQYLRNSHTISGDTLVTVTQKLHGTSIRIGRVKVKRKLTWLERLAKRLGVNVVDEEYDNVYGSRRVIKDANDPDQQHFYETSGDDLWTLEGKKLDGIVPEDYVFYGELIGWTPEGAAIQSNYTYNEPAKERSLYIYRIAHVSDGGRRVVDLSWDQVKQMCDELGLKHVPELWSGFHRDFDPNDWLEKRYYDEGFKNAVPLSGSKKLVDEGVVVRAERLVPYCLKLKSPTFMQHETKLLDKGDVDLESQEV